MKPVIFILFIPFFLIAMEKDKPLALTARISNDKKLYLRTFNDLNPVVNALSKVLNEFKDDQKREELNTPSSTSAQHAVRAEIIAALEGTKILLDSCIREINDLHEIIIRKGEGITMQQQSALAYKIDAENLGEKLKEVQQKANELETQIDINKRLLKKQQEQFTRAYSKAILYRNTFAVGFFISAVVFFGLLFFKK